MIGDDDWMGLIQRVATLEAQVSSIRTNDLHRICCDLKDVKRILEDRLLNRGSRPPWNVVWLLTFMGSLCVGLLVALVK